MKFSHLFAAIFILAPFLFSGCFNFLGDWHYEEIERIQSPDGIVEAVFVRGNGGATTGFAYSVFIVPNGAPFDEKSSYFDQERAVFNATEWDDLNLVWREPKFLEIRYNKAHIFKFANNWHGDNRKYLVEIRLVPLDNKSSLFDED